MAIGIACLWGIDVDKNFDCPYLASNPSDFWKRWHISLSQWLRDYLYIPLGGNRKGEIKACINILITMLLGGLWHGASWNFVLWGGLHGIAQIIHRVYSRCLVRKKIRIIERKTYKIICIILNTFFATCCWIVFRLQSIEDIKTVFYGIVTAQSGINYIYIYSVIILALAVVYYVYTYRKKDGHSWYLIMDLSKPRNLFLFSFFIWIIMLYGYTGNNAFIYFQF